MKHFAIASSFTAAIFVAAQASAASVDAVSFSTVDYRFRIVSSAPDVGALPDGITTSSPGPIDANVRTRSQIDDPTAAVTIDDNDVQVGCATCDPPIPFVADRRLRTNRGGATEFADSQYDVEILSTQDVPSGTIHGQSDQDREGLAQLRLEDNLVDAFADSHFTQTRRTEITNTTLQDLSFLVVLELDAYLLARYGGTDGFARTSVLQTVSFSGMTQDSLSLIVQQNDTLSDSVIGAGADIAQSLSSVGGTGRGLFFSASTSAFGADPFNEAEYSVATQFSLLVDLAAGQSTVMETAFAQTNYVEHTVAVAPVPLPASILLLSGALLVPCAMSRRRKKPISRM